MIKKHKLSFFLIVLLAFCMQHCQEETFPNGFHGYQIAKLLATDLNKKWITTSFIKNDENIALEKCSDSIYFNFKNAKDSILVFQYKLKCNEPENARFFAEVDTLLYDYGRISQYQKKFTDSIVFSDDNYWIVESLTSQYFKFRSYNAKEISTYELKH